MKNTLFCLLITVTNCLAQGKGAIAWWADSDNTAPTVVVSSNAVQPVYTGTFTATFIFSEAVTGFTSGDLTISGASSGSVSTSDNITFTATITPTFLNDISIQVPAAACADGGSNVNTASNILSVVASYPVGTIHTDNFDDGSLSEYTQTGSTMSIVSSNLRINTTAGVFTNYLRLTTPNATPAHTNNALEKWIMSAKFVAVALNATSYGFAMGVRSTNGPEQFDSFARIAFDQAQEAKTGSVYYYSAQNHSGSPSQTVATIGATFTMVVGTTYTFEVERNKNVMTARLKSADGLTTHKTYTSLTYNQTSTNTTRAANYGQFCIWAFGGTIDITDVVVTSNALKNPAILAILDSNGSLYAGSNSSRYIEQVATALGRSYEIMWGVNAEIPDAPLVSALNLANTTYTKIFVCLGSNDESNGVADATWQTRYSTMFSTLSSGGFGSSKVVIGIPVARNGQDIAAIKTHLDATYSSYIRVDGYTTTKNAGNTSLQAAYNIGDNIHLTTAGHNAMVTPTQTGLQ